MILTRYAYLIKICEIHLALIPFNLFFFQKVTFFCCVQTLIQFVRNVLIFKILE